MNARRGLAALLATLLLLGTGVAVAANPCADGGVPAPDDGGIGGTGAHPDDGGIGGTGARPGDPDDDGGIGGTGITAQGDTGVIGVITGFASICVGGVEVHYDAQSVVTIDDRAATTRELAVGQVVEVVAAGTGGEVTARQIAVRHVVAGPVTRVDVERGEVDVVGQTVRLTADTRGDAADVAVGTTVAVSGMRQADGAVVASRLTRTESSVAAVQGALDSLDGERAVVAGTLVRLSEAGTVAVGDEVRVVGRWENGAIVADAMRALPRVPFGGRVARLEVEGYVAPGRPGQLRVGPYAFDLTDRDAPPFAATERVRVVATIEDRRAVVERVGAAPALPPRPQLRDGAGRDGRTPPPDGAARESRGRPPAPGERGAPAPRPAGMERGAPERPDRPERAAPPDRPAPIDRPPRPVRGDVPDRPQRPERPQRPGRP